MELSDEYVIDYNEKLLVTLKAKEPCYSIIARSRKYNISPGNRIEIDIYITGLGIPDNNKLYAVFSSPDVIDNSIMGTLKSCIKLGLDKLKDKDTIFPLSGNKYFETHELDTNGTTIHLNKGYFLPVPKSAKPVGSEEKLGSEGQDFMEVIMAEKQFDGYDPISLSLPTLKTAKSGDYEIYFTLTYEYQNVIKQASHKTQFHITSWWDRNQAKVVIASAIVAVAAFVLLALTYVNSL